MNGKLLGKQIRKLRKEKGFTGEQLSELVKISATHLRQLECGSRLPSLPCFVALANALEVSPAILLQDSLTRIDDAASTDLSKKLQSLSPKKFGMVCDMMDVLLEHLEEF